MISGITTICFAASYAVALLLELARLLLRSGWRTALALGFVARWAGSRRPFLGLSGGHGPGHPALECAGLVSCGRLVAGGRASVLDVSFIPNWRRASLSCRWFWR